MQIYEALTKDHEKVKQLLSELIMLSDDNDDRATALIKNIRDELIPHARAEESVFYNTLRAIAQTKPLVMHGYQEHVEAETLLRLLQVKDRFSADWRNDAVKLRDALEHHIEEEEGEIFAAAKQLFTDDEAEVLGEMFEKLKPEIKEENFMQTSLDLIVNMLPPRITDMFQGSGSPKS